jgi:hypothetical protein
MSRTNYYQINDSYPLIQEPGEVCDGCCKLPPEKAGSMVPMPCDASHEEYGHESGDIHMHLECAIKARDEYKRLYAEADAAIKAFEVNNG